MSDRYRLNGDTIRRIDGFLPVASVYSGRESCEMVRRANCYDDLLGACLLAMKFWYSDHPNDTVEGHQARRTIQAAIAKAIRAPAPEHVPGT